MNSRINQVVKFFGIIALVAAFAAAAFPARSFANSLPTGSSDNPGKAVIAVFDATVPTPTSDPKPVAGAQLELIDASGSPVAKALTGKDGTAVFELAEGNYKVRIVATGYKAAEVGISVTSDGTTYAKVGLTKKSSLTSR